MGENSGQGQGQGETLPQEGDQVQWKWGPGHPQGTVAQAASTGDISIQTRRGNTVKKNADPENPALLITRTSGQDVVKRASEVEVIGHNDNATSGGGSAEGGSSGSRKRKEQASTPTKQGEKEKGGPVKRGRGRPPKNRNTAKKVRTGKEADVIASDNEDAQDDDDDDAEYDEEEDDNQDPEETEDEKDKAGKDANGEGEVETGEGNKDTAADAETLFGSPVVPKSHAPPHGHGHGHGHHGHSQSHGAIPPFNPNKTGFNGNDKNRSQSISAGGGGGGSSTKKGIDPAGEEEPKRASIDALLNEDGEDENNQQSKGHGHGHGNPTRHAKQVAEEKIAAVAAGKEAHPGAPLEVPGAGTGAAVAAAAAADDGYNPEVDALLQA